MTVLICSFLRRSWVFTASVECVQGRRALLCTVDRAVVFHDQQERKWHFLLQLGDRGFCVESPLLLAHLVWARVWGAER